MISIVFQRPNEFYAKTKRLEDIEYLLFPNNEVSIKPEILKQISNEIEEYSNTGIPSSYDPSITIEISFEDNSDLLVLIQLVNYVRDVLKYRDKSKNVKIELSFDYFPYSRLDRQVPDENGAPANVFALKGVANIINSLKADKVIIHEPHSDMCVALVNNSVVVNATLALTEKYIHYNFWNTEDKYTKAPAMLDFSRKDIYICIPDTGAYKKYNDNIALWNKMHKNIGFEPGVIIMDKIRDFNTGKITKIRLKSGPDKIGIKNATIIIIDDLCSKGGTFIGTAEVLKAMYPGVNIDLVVNYLEKSSLDGELFTSDLIRTVVSRNTLVNKILKNIAENKFASKEVINNKLLLFDL